MKGFRVVLRSLVLAAAALAVLGLGAALAQEAKQPTATSLKLGSGPRMDEKGNPAKGQLLLSATLATVDGKPLSDRRVDFYLPVELFGAREATLGSATTDSTGVAYLLYLPAQLGPQTVKASFPGADGYANSVASQTIQVTDVETPFEPEPLPLASVRQWLPIGVGLLVVSTWVVLLGVFLRTALGIRALGARAAVSSLERGRHQAAPAPAQVRSARR